MKLLLFLLALLPAIFCVYQYDINVLTDVLSCSPCSNGRIFRPFRYNNTFDYSVTCQFLGGTSLSMNFSSGLYNIDVCGGSQANSKLFCDENGIFPAGDSDPLAATPFPCAIFFNYSILLLTTSTLCEECDDLNNNCFKNQTCAPSDSSLCSDPAISIFNGARCQSELISNTNNTPTTCAGSMPRCCYFNCETVTCINETCEFVSSTTVPTPTPSLSPSSSIVPTSHIAPTPGMSSTTHFMPSTSSIIDPPITVTNSPNNATDSEQNTMLILVTVIPGAVIIIIAMLVAFVAALLALICLKGWKRAFKSPIREATNYENVINGNGNDILLTEDPSLNPTNPNGQSNAQEPVYYSVIPDRPLSNPNGYVYASYNSLKTDSEKQKEFKTSYEYVVNDVYSDLVEGEVVDQALYGDSPMNRSNALLLNPSDSLEMNPFYNSSGENQSKLITPYIEPSKSLPELKSNLQCCPFQIKKEDLEIGKRFASGHFGLVYRATYHTRKGDIPVAVKSLKQAANPDMTLAFMREAATLAQFNHPNVLRLIGVLTTQHQHQPWMIVTELLRTELREFLLKLKVTDRNSSSSSSSSNLQLQGVVLHTLLLKFSQEIAAGMAYLTEKKFIHRDLAARNVLVAKDLTIRVADFGMSREIDSPENSYYTSSGGRVPLRWTAPEALFYMKYSEKSDVWSFGVTLYEIWSLGDKPWGNASNEEVIQALSTERILSAPTGCPEDVYQVMVRTWVKDKTVRPTFNELKTILSSVNLSSFYHRLTEMK